MSALHYPLENPQNQDIVRGMRPIWKLLPLVAVLLVGCATAQKDNLSRDYPKERVEVHRRLLETFDAAEKKDFNRLDSYHFYGPKFTKFAPEASGRLDAQAARKGEHEGLGPIANLSMRAEDLKIDVFGDVAVATFVFNYSFTVEADSIRRQAFASMVFVKDRGEWKITHEHFSAPKTNP